LPRYRRRRGLALDQSAAFRSAHLPSFRDKKILCGRLIEALLRSPSSSDF
jgi:hypothetical protein